VIPSQHQRFAGPPAAFASLLLSLVPLQAQGAAVADGLSQLLEQLEDPDRDELRELALRGLSAWPESPAPRMRAWAAGGGFRRQAALLRVLGERQELRPKELRAGLTARHWVVRFEAVRAAGNCAELEGFEDALHRCLEDEFVAVRREALHALARRGQLRSDELRALIAQPSLRGTAARVWLAEPGRYPAELLAELLRHPVSRGVVLERGMGWIPEHLRAPVRALAHGEENPPLARAWALLHLPIADWPERPERLALAGMRSEGEGSGTGMRLGGLLPQEAKLRLLDDVFSAEESECFDRLVLAYPVPAASLRPILERHAELPDESLALFLRFVRRVDQRLLADFASKNLAKVEREERLFAWVTELAPLLLEHRELAPVFERILRGEQGGEGIASLAYRACISARVAREAAIAWASASRERLQRHGRLLLLLPDPAPAELFLRYAADEEPRLRSFAASGLRRYVGDGLAEDVQDGDKSTRSQVKAAVRAGFAGESSEIVRSAWLYALLAFVEPDELERIVTQLVAQKDRLVRLSLRKWFETSKRAFVDAFLRERTIPGWEREALLLRGTRGDEVAGRLLWEQLDQLDEAELLRARKAVQKTLRPEDRALFAERLLGAGESRALPHVRDELITLLRQRRDLPWAELLREAFGREKDQIVREQLAAALAERDEFEALEAHIARWIDSRTPDDEGLLLEVMGALDGAPGPEELRFLVRVLVAPIARDPVATVRRELERLRSYRRVEAQFPLLRPAVLGLARADAEQVAEALRREFLSPERVLEWAQASKGYLLLALNERRGAAVDLSALAPLVEWALRLGPRPHRADGELLLLESELARREGRFGQAAMSWRSGMRELLQEGLPTRELERISRDLVGAPELGWAALHAHGAWLAAIAALAGGDAAQAQAEIERAQLAARGDGRLRARMMETRTRIEEASRSQDERRR
jgi:hypothetical protein